MRNRSKSLFARAQKHIPGGVNSPVRAFRSVGGEPIFMKSGKGCHIADVDGVTYIDYIGSWGPLILGHRAHEVQAALRQQISRGTSFGAPTENEADLEECLKLYLTIRPDRLQTFRLTYFPGTEIIKYGLQENCITAEDVKEIEEGYIGNLHLAGSMQKDKARSYEKYAVLFHALTIFTNDRVFNKVSKILLSLPLKRQIEKVLMLLVVFKNRDFRLFNYLKFIWTKKNVP